MGTVQKTENFIKQDKKCLLAHGERSHFSKGQTLFYQDHYPSGLYWILAGQIALIHVGNGQEHSEYKEAEAILGLEELLKGEAFHFTAQALSDCEVCFISKIVFQDWLKHRES